MAAWQRFAILIVVTVANAIAGIIYYRVGVEHLFPMAQGGSSGPFTPAVGTLETLVPIVIAVIQLGVVVWVVVGGGQKERSALRGPR